MRFACDSCQTRYTLADEKIRGRVLKIRCKKCSGVIVVRDPALQGAVPAGAQAQSQAGGQAATAASPGPAAASREQQATRSIPMAEAMQLARSATGSAGLDPIWYALRRGEQLGPMPREELAARVAAAELGPRTYVWREGMEDWQRMERVDELADLLGPSAAAAPSNDFVPPPQAPTHPHDETPVEAPFGLTSEPAPAAEAASATEDAAPVATRDDAQAPAGLDPMELFGTSPELLDTPELPQQPHPAAEMPELPTGAPPVVEQPASTAPGATSRLLRLVAVAVLLAALLAAGAYFLLPAGGLSATEGAPHPAATQALD